MNVLAQRELLRRLERCTPPPPSEDVDPSQVLSEAQALVEQRAACIAEMQIIVKQAPGAFRDDAACREILLELERRGAGWRAALARAARITQQRLVASRRLRRERQVRPGDAR